MNFIKEKLTDDVIRGIFAITVLILLLVALRPFKNLILLTFIFVFMFSKMQNFIYSKIGKRYKINKKIITISMFILTIGLMVISLLIYIPKLSHELIQVKNSVLSIVNSSKNPILQKYSEQVLSLDYMGLLKDNSDTAIKTLSKVQDGAVTFALSLILSLFFLLEENVMMELGNKLSRSKLKFFYIYYKELGRKFLNSFGTVIQVQLTVAVINGILSVMGLMALGFPEPLALGFMILILSLIPVLGVVISLFPLGLIAFQIGGINKIIVVLIFIAILHALESYVISPKLMSHKSHLPIFLVFLTLVIGEHLLGMWGLLIGVPLLMFFMEVFEVK